MLNILNDKEFEGYYGLIFEDSQSVNEMNQKRTTFVLNSFCEALIFDWDYNRCYYWIEL